MDDKTTERVVRGTPMMEATVRQWMRAWEKTTRERFDPTPWFHVIPVEPLAFYDPVSGRWEERGHRYRIQVSVYGYAVLDECVVLAEEGLDKGRQQRLVTTHLS